MAKILVIEDEMVIRHMVVKFLEKAGHTVLKAVDGDEGLSIAQAETPELIITDILMPKVDGISVIRTLNDSENTPKIIAISGGGFNRKEYYLKIAQALGTEFILEKPFKPAELTEAVDEILKH